MIKSLDLEPLLPVYLWRQKKKEEQDWRMMQLPNCSGCMEMDEERKARLEKMVATAQLMLALIKGVVDVGVILSLKHILATMLIIQT